MEREVAPLIGSWRTRWIEHDGREYKLFEKEEAALICSGIGQTPARRATEAIIRRTEPDRVLSVGFAGALDPALRVGEIIEPRIVINAADGARWDTGSGQGTLVSFAAVAGLDQKRKLRDSYGAAIVDMEAAAVAQGAEICRASFAALKVVSDEACQSLPALDKFIGADGTFRSARFALHVVFRPWVWGATILLARNSSRASGALCSALEMYMNRVVAEPIAARD